MIIEKYGIILRTVEEDDADFILSLRLNNKLGRYISKTDDDIKKQIEWISAYKAREKNKDEFYFINVGENSEKFGVCRIYDFNSDSFESGSWLFDPNAPKGFSVLSDLISRDYGFEELKFPICRFNVNKMNNTVLNYNSLFKPTIVDENESTIWFELDYERYKKQRDRLIRMLYKNK